MKKELVGIQKYDTFIYHSFKIDYTKDTIKITFFYEIKDLSEFNHIIEIPYTNTEIDKSFLENLCFNFGMLELVSYYKLTVAKKIIVECGTLNEEQIAFFKKVYFHGLGEFFYVNGLDPNYDDFLSIESFGPIYKDKIDYTGSGNLIAIGGGKDSCVTLELVDKKDSNCFIINPKPVMLECAYAAGYNEDEICKVKRSIDKRLIELNNEGFLNGHTPFSAMVAFVSYLSAYLNNKKYVILSNEASANEANVAGTKINHQYSKSFEFELDFQNYAQKYLGGIIKYYSLLRPLTEYQIGMLFAKMPKYHPIFKSCNVGSKSNPWIWCGKCAKCLFVYSLLSPHLYKEELVKIFGHDLFDDISLLTTFRELLGYENVKPFDCVGTFKEVNYAITKTINKIGSKELPFLLEYYKNNYYDEKILSLNLENFYDSNNSLDSNMEKLIKDVIK